VKKYLSIVVFFLIYNNFVYATQNKEIQEVAKKIYVKLKGDCQSDELLDLQSLNITTEEIDDLKNMLNIKLSILEKNITHKKVINLTIYSSVFSLSTLFIYIPLLYLLENCHDDECYRDLLKNESHAALVCLCALTINAAYMVKNYEKLICPIKNMPKNSTDIINKLINHQPYWFQEVLKELEKEQTSAVLQVQNLMNQ